MTTSRSILVTAIFATLLCTQTLNAASFKCWVNKQGVRECGNVVPPEYAQKGHEEISDQGTVINKVERALTKEEVEERKRLAAEKKQKEALQAEKERRDQVLMQTYNSIEEIEMAKRGKLAAINTELGIFMKNLEGAKKRLKGLHGQAANSERNGKPVPENILKDIKKAQKQVDNYMRFVNSKNEEKKKITAKFAEDIERYKSLRSAQLTR
jgi:hypothetical protein